jgi:hypothetical protein
VSSSKSLTQSILSGNVLLINQIGLVLRGSIRKDPAWRSVVKVAPLSWVDYHLGSLIHGGCIDERLSCILEVISIIHKVLYGDAAVRV